MQFKNYLSIGPLCVWVQFKNPGKLETWGHFSDCDDLVLIHMYVQCSTVLVIYNPNSMIEVHALYYVHVLHWCVRGEKNSM